MTRPPNIESLARELATARRKVAQASAALQRKHQGGEWAAFAAAHAEQKRLERELALAKGEEAAIPYEWNPPWDTGAPLPHIVASDTVTLFLYYVSTPDPDWDGTYVNVIDPSEPEAMSLAIVEVQRCYAHRFGAPNDEVFHGHPLAQRGLDSYGAYTVENSHWLRDLQAINSVHTQYRSDHWKSHKHFFLAFHDNVLECIATGFNIEPIHTTFADALDIMVKRVVGRHFS